MKLPIRSVFAALSLFFITPSCQAAEPSEGANNWQGFYAGVNAGWGLSDDGISSGCIDIVGVVNGSGCQNVPNSSLDASGVIGGVQAGYNRQTGQNIIGVEIDFQGTDINGSRTDNGPFLFYTGLPVANNAQFTAQDRLEWFSTARLRFGHAITDRTIIYGTGGLAVGRYELKSNFIGDSALPFTFPVTKSVTKVGWTIGGGIERAFFQNGTLKLEALYYDLGDEKISGGCAPGCPAGAVGFIRDATFDLRGTVVRVGFNWALGH